MTCATINQQKGRLTKWLAEILFDSIFVSRSQLPPLGCQTFEIRQIWTLTSAKAVLMTDDVAMVHRYEPREPIYESTKKAKTLKNETGPGGSEAAAVFNVWERQSHTIQRPWLDNIIPSSWSDGTAKSLFRAGHYGAFLFFEIDI